MKWAEWRLNEIFNRIGIVRVRKRLDHLGLVDYAIVTVTHINNRSMVGWPVSLVGDREFVYDVEVAYHHAELTEGDFAVKIGVSLDNSTINELLKLNIIQVVSNHHLEHLEKLTIGDKSVIIDVVNLESESQLFFLTSTC